MRLRNFKIAGCLFGGLLGLWIVMKIFKEERKNIFDTVLEGMFLCAGVAKSGCFAQGCCYGKPTNVPWAISYPDIGLYDVHPVQLYEAFVWWIGVVLLLELKDKVKDSTRISIVVLFYVILRMFAIEGLYYGAQFFENGVMNFIYITAIIVCTLCIINDKKEIFKYGKAKEKQ